MTTEQRFFPVTVPYQGPGPSQDFGPRQSGNHRGVDFTPPIRIQDHHRDFGILAYRGGVVTVAQHGTRYGMVEIEHSDGTFARYLHNYSVRVVEGATVLAGEHIANMGRRGPSGANEYQAPHLHFELRDTSGNPYDPEPYLLLNKNPHPDLVIRSHSQYGPPRSEGGGL